MEKRRSVGMQIDHPPDIFGRSDVGVCKAAKFAGGAQPVDVTEMIEPSQHVQEHP